jgi:hypothetical protein
VSDAEKQITVRSVPMFDTGIGREAGYANDAELIAAAAAEREALPPALRDLMDRLDAELTRRVVEGDGSG